MPQPARRPSAALLVAMLALVIAVSGTAIAASSLVNGDKLIKKGTLSGNRLRDHTLSGKQINVSRIGTVPAAIRARSAASADSATHAASADSATTVGGLHVVKFRGTGAAVSQTLLSLGGLELTYSCDPGAIDSVSLNASTTVDGASIYLSRTADKAYLEQKTSFNTGDTFPLAGYVGTGVYTNPNGQVVSFTYQNSLYCTPGVAGTATGG